YWRDFDSNADLVQRYRSGVPDSVIVYNTPTHSREHLNADLGFYVQDSWKLRRLTLNPGIRFEYFSVSIEPKSIEPGRFVGFRQFPEMPNLPEWFNVAPRLGAVYDLTGDAKTALRLGVDRELFSGVSVTAAWYRRVFYNLEKQINTLVSLSDYTAFQTASPLDGEPVTIYNLNRAKQGLVDLIDTTSTDRDKSRQTFDGLEVSFSAQLPRGGSVFGGLSS